jgi:uroporphyrinogen decarboxylase
MNITPIREKWKSTMTGRERFKRQMHYQTADRSFNTEFGFWTENYSQWDLFVQNGIKNHKEANVFFGFDKLHFGIGNFFIFPLIAEKEIEVRDNKRIIMNGDGNLAEVPLAGGGSSIPHFLKSSVTTPEVWKRMKEEHFDINYPGRFPDFGADSASVASPDTKHPYSAHGISLESLKYYVPDDEKRDFPLGISCGSMIGKIRDMLTFEGLAYACADYPEMVEDMVETCCLLVENLLDRVLPHFHFDYAAGWEDICFKNGPIVSPDFFKEVVVPRYKRIKKKLEAHGIDIWYTDCDGDVRPLLPYFLDGGINCIFPFEVNSSGHPGEVLDKYEGQLRIMGGVDKLRLGEGKEAILAYMKSIEKYVARGGFIPFVDHMCPPNVKPEDYLYYLDLKEKMFGMG